MSYLCPSFISRSLETSKKRRERLFLENGSLLLKELIASSNGKYNQFRSYSAEELKKATSNYDPRCAFHGNYCGDWYRGTIEGRVVSVHKMPDENRFKSSSQGATTEGRVVSIHKMPDKYGTEYFCQRAATDISYSAMLSGHKNVLKLLGCCLQTMIPTIVYEYAGNGNLHDRIHTSAETDFQPLPWKSRVEIAGQIAHTIAYLHTAFAKPIIHRRLWASNILLDQNDVVKLCDFSESMTIRQGETIKVDGYTCMIGFSHCDEGFWVNEKTDVICFGVILLKLLTGKYPHDLHKLATGSMDFLVIAWEPIKDYISCHSIGDIGDPTFFLAEGGVSEQQQYQWKTVKDLALKCIAFPREERPTMVEITKELWQIKLS